MVEFNCDGDTEFNNFLKATSFIQEYTRRLLDLSTKRIVKIPENLTSINQLACLVKQFLEEQRELAVKVGTVQETQRNFNNLIKDRLDKCACEMELSVKSMLPAEIKLEDLRRHDGSEFSLKIPTTSTATFDPSTSIDAEAQQRIDLELLKMMESVSHDGSQHHENGLLKFQNLESTFSFESPPERKKSGKSGRKRQMPSDSPIGPYQCRDCDKTFRQKHGLSQHLLTHESNGAFECDGCGKRYSRQESVYRHQRSTQCTKYQTLTNVRHDDMATILDMKNLPRIPEPNGFLL